MYVVKGLIDDDDDVDDEEEEEEEEDASCSGWISISFTNPAFFLGSVPKGGDKTYPLGT